MVSGFRQTLEHGAQVSLHDGCSSILVGLVAVPAAGHVYEHSQCIAWIAYQLGANEVLTVVVEIILIVRSASLLSMIFWLLGHSLNLAVYAMYNRNVVVTTTVYVLFVAEVVAMCTILALTVPKFESTPHCLITSTPKLFSSYWCGSPMTSFVILQL